MEKALPEHIQDTGKEKQLSLKKGWKKFGASVASPLLLCQIPLVVLPDTSRH